MGSCKLRPQLATLTVTVQTLVLHLISVLSLSSPLCWPCLITKYWQQTARIGKAWQKFESPITEKPMITQLRVKHTTEDLFTTAFHLQMLSLFFLFFLYFVRIAFASGPTFSSPIPLQCFDSHLARSFRYSAGYL